MRTIGRRRPSNSPQGDFKAMCVDCGVHWYRSRMRMTEIGLLCPDCDRGLNRHELDDIVAQHEPVRFDRYIFDGTPAPRYVPDPTQDSDDDGNPDSLDDFVRFAESNFHILVDVWDANLGIAFDANDLVDTWTGQHAGIVLQAGGVLQACRYQESSEHFLGRPAVVTSRGENRWLRSGDVTDDLNLPAGSRLYLGVIGRKIQAGPGIAAIVSSVTHSAQAVVWRWSAQSGFWQLRVWTADLLTHSYGAIKQVDEFEPHLWESWNDGAAARGAIDGVEAERTNSPAYPIALTGGTETASARVAVGGSAAEDNDGTGSYEITAIVVARDATPAEITAMRNMAGSMYA